MSNTKSVISHGFLALSSGWALSQCTDLPFATVGFGLYLVNGVLGVASYGSNLNNLELYKVYSSIFHFTLILIIPLISTQLYIINGFPMEAALLHFIFPLLYLVTLQLIKSKRSELPLQVFQAGSLISLSYISLITNRYYGISTVVSYAISFYVIGTTGMVKNIPSKDLFNFSILFSNYFTIRSFRGQ